MGSFKKTATATGGYGRALPHDRIAASMPHNSCICNILCFVIAILSFQVVLPGAWAFLPAYE